MEFKCLSDELPMQTAPIHVHPWRYVDNIRESGQVRTPPALPAPHRGLGLTASLTENTNKHEEIWEEKRLKVSAFQPHVQNISNKLWQFLYPIGV